MTRSIEDKSPWWRYLSELLLPAAFDISARAADLSEPTYTLHLHGVPYVRHVVRFLCGRLARDAIFVLFGLIFLDADYIFPRVSTQFLPCRTATKDMGERKIHMQKPLFRVLESLTLRRIGPHFLLYASEDITKQYRR